MFFIIIRTKQPARCPEVGDVFGVNAVSPYDQRYHIQTLETLTKGTRISLFRWIHLCLSSVCVKIRILMRFPIWCVSYNTKIFLDVQLVSCYTIFWYRTRSHVRMVQDVHCHPVLWRIVQVCHPPLLKWMIHGHEDHEIHNLFSLTYRCKCNTPNWVNSWSENLVTFKD